MLPYTPPPPPPSTQLFEFRELLLTPLEVDIEPCLAASNNPPASATNPLSV